MKVEQIYTGCLAQGAYYIESKGEVAIIDPLRDTKPYVEKAKENDATIKYIFETHFHADFVSGHLDLARETGAKIVFGPTAQTAYDAHTATDGETFKLGDLTIKVLHTPGHTMESSTFLLIDENGKNHAIFSGDTLFIGDVGRPDLAVKSDLSKEDLAKLLYKSLREKIMPLEDEVIVYPAHGAGSACGKNMSSETWDTLGNQKKTNYALNPEMTEEEFVKEVTTGLLPPPYYFPKNAMMNKQGYDSFEENKKTGLNPLTPEEFEQVAEQEDALILDTRHPQTFKDGFIPQSINIGLDGDFAPWVGNLITDIKQEILLVTDEGREEEALTRLARVGYDHVLGYLKGGVSAWKNANKELDSIESISPAEFANRMKNDELYVVDVRKPNEYISEHVIGAENAPLNFINNEMDKFSKEKTNYIHCQGGYRSMITSSILKARGIHNLVDVSGGFKAIKETDVEVSNYVCPSTLA
jgi:hydroxyacylglutathione hydrolase